MALALLSTSFPAAFAGTGCNRTLTTPGCRLQAASAASGGRAALSDPLVDLLPAWPPLASPRPRRTSALARRRSAAAAAALSRPALPTIPLALAGLLVALAVLVAPEQPRDQEAICHRHAGVEACRVW